MHTVAFASFHNPSTPVSAKRTTRCSLLQLTRRCCLTFYFQVTFCPTCGNSFPPETWVSCPEVHISRTVYNAIFWVRLFSSPSLSIFWDSSLWMCAVLPPLRFTSRHRLRYAPEPCPQLSSYLPCGCPHHEYATVCCSTGCSAVNSLLQVILRLWFICIGIVLFSFWLLFCCGFYLFVWMVGFSRQFLCVNSTGCPATL